MKTVAKHGTTRKQLEFHFNSLLHLNKSDSLLGKLCDLSIYRTMLLGAATMSDMLNSVYVADLRAIWSAREVAMANLVWQYINWQLRYQQPQHNLKTNIISWPTHYVACTLINFGVVRYMSVTFFSFCF